MPKLNVLYFAHIRERVGIAAETLSLPEGATVGDAVDALIARHPSVAPLIPVTRVALNGEFVTREISVPDGAELVLIPPVSGGAGIARTALTDGPLDHECVQALEALVSDARFGAVVTFQGAVRNHARGHAVSALHYEAYRPMAEAQLAAIADAVEAQFEGVRVAVHHRVGSLDIGDIAVVVCAASAHRGPAFDACRLLIDRLKEDVPIWKRETGPDGAEWVSDRP